MWTNFTLAFASTKLLTYVEFRAFSSGVADIYLDRVIMKRVSSNVTSDFGLKTLNSDDLSLFSGYVNGEGFLTFSQHTASSCFWHGPYMSLPSGKYRVTFLLKISPLPKRPDENVLSLDVSANSGEVVYAKCDVTASDFLIKDAPLDWQKFTLEFITRDPLYNVEFRGLSPSPNFTISLAYVLLEKRVLSSDQNYELFNVQRGLQVEAGQIVSDTSSESGKVALSRKGVNEGNLIYGPYIALSSGSYHAVFRVKASGTSANASVLFEVVSQPHTRILSNMTLPSSGLQDGSWFNVVLPFSLEVSTSNIEFRVSSNGMTNLYVDTVRVLFQ